MTTCDETTCDEIETYRHANLAALSLRALNLGPSNLASLTKLLLFVVMQCLTVILIGFAALFVSFEPVWSEEAPQVFARPGDAHTGSLLLKTDDGYADATRIGGEVYLTVSGRRSAPRHADLSQPDASGSGDLRHPARRRRGRYAQDGGRRPRHCRRHQERQQAG
jgi:hypothetical protein